MIKKLKQKFILLSSASFFVLLLVMVASMNILNYTSIIKESDTTLSILYEHKDAPSKDDLPEPKDPTPDFDEKNPDRSPRDVSPEIPFESRYFTVIFDKQNNATEVDVDHIISINDTQAKELALLVIDSGKTKGFVGNYRYSVTYDESGTKIIFLDCGRKFSTFLRFLFISVFIAAAGFIVVFFVLCFFSEKILRPISESYKKQRRFITDAGHEIKTPLTIINANLDLLQMELGDNECIDDVKQQTKRLTDLTNDLVTLSRIEEVESNLQKIEFPISEIICEVISSFENLAANQNKTISINVADSLTYKGNIKQIERLTSTLLENAVKYSPENSTINVSLLKQARSIELTMHNKTNYPVESEDLHYLFDRFYRADKSRNSQTGGHGIGLSIAKAIVDAHQGKITVLSTDKNSFQITVILPV